MATLAERQTKAQESIATSLRRIAVALERLAETVTDEDGATAVNAVFLEAKP